MVYVLNKDGQPLMPTNRHGKVRRLLKTKKAKVIKRCPFTIQLLYDTTNHTQDITLGVDAGSKHIGLSATTKNKVLFEADVELRNDISKLLEARYTFRRSRRNRKTRYRKKRFDNRVSSKHKGWLAPSIEHKIQSHFAMVEKLHRILPVTKIVVETASFDTQLLKAQLEGKPIPEGTDYQNGELAGWNIREYIFHRDNYTCQWCKGKSKDPVLVTHHHAYWKGDHTNKPSSLITLCNTCNDSKYHKKEANRLWGWEPKITNSYKHAVFMGVMRWTFYNRLKEIYPNVSMTYGYITKNTRIENNLPKAHYVDARCISGHPEAKSNGEYFYYKKVRCHNRQLHKANTLKGGIRKRNQAEYTVKGFRLFDRVEYKNNEYFVFGRRASGFFDIRTLDGQKVNKGSISFKKLKLKETSKTYLIERRMADTGVSLAPLTTEVTSLRQTG